MVWARGIEVGHLTGGEIDGGGDRTRWWWRLMEAKGLGFERRPAVAFKGEGERSEVRSGAGCRAPGRCSAATWCPPARGEEEGEKGEKNEPRSASRARCLPLPPRPRASATACAAEPPTPRRLTVERRWWHRE